MGLALGGRGSSRTLPSPCSQRGWSPTGTLGAPGAVLFLAVGWVRGLGALRSPQALGQALLSRFGWGGDVSPQLEASAGALRGDRDRAAELGTRGPRARGEVGMGRTDPAQRGGARTGAALGLGAPLQAEQPPRCPWLGAHSAARRCELGLWEQQRRGLDSGRFGGAHAEQPSGLSSAKSIPTARTRLEHVSGTPGLKRFRRGEPVVPEGSLARAPGGGCCEERARKSP